MIQAILKYLSTGVLFYIALVLVFFVYGLGLDIIVGTAQHGPLEGIYMALAYALTFPLLILIYTFPFIALVKYAWIPGQQYIPYAVTLVYSLIINSFLAQADTIGGDHILTSLKYFALVSLAIYLVSKAVNTFNSLQFLKGQRKWS